MTRRRRSATRAAVTSPSSRRVATWVDGEVALAAAVGELEALYAALPALACKGLCQHSCDEHVEASDLEHARARTAGVDLTVPTATGACPALVATFGAGHCGIHPVRPMVCRLWGIAASMPCPHGCLPDLAGWSVPSDVERGHRAPGATTADPSTEHVADQGTDQVADVDVEHDALLQAGRPTPAGAVGQPRQAPSRVEGTGTHSERSASPVRPPTHLPDAVALRSMMAVLHLGGHDTVVPGVTDLLEACAGDELAAGLMARLLRGDASVRPALGARLQQLRAATPWTGPPSAARTAATTTPSGSTGGGAR